MKTILCYNTHCFSAANFIYYVTAAHNRWERHRYSYFCSPCSNSQPSQPGIIRATLPRNGCAKEA